MTKRELVLRRRLEKHLGRYARKTLYYKASLGNGSIINVPGLSGWVYVTDFAGQVHSAFNGNVVPTSSDHLGEVIKVGYYEDQPTTLRVIGMLDPYAQITTPSINIDHTDLEWPSPNTVWSYGPAIIPAGVLADNATMTVTIQPFVLRMQDGTGKQVFRQTLDMAPYIPKNRGYWALISFSGITGLPVVTTDGPVATTPELLYTVNNPSTPKNCRALAAVALFAGQTKISQNAIQNQIRDLRWVYHRSDKNMTENLDYYDDAPLPPGSAWAGDVTTPARGNHVHPLQFIYQILASLEFVGFLSPAQITANQNDYNPAGLANATVMRLTLNANHNITGLQAGKRGRFLIVHNVDTTFSATLKHEDSGSTAANRFVFPGAADLTLAPDSVAALQYDDISGRWRALAGGAGGSGSGDMLKAVYDVDNSGVVDDSESTQALRGKTIDAALSPAPNDVLQWDGSKWTAAVVTGGGGGGSNVGDLLYLSQNYS